MKNNVGREEKEVFAAYIASHGLKRSEQREVILDAFLRSERHLSVDDLLGLVQKKRPDIGRTTVYRTLKLLREAGLASPALEHREHLGLYVHGHDAARRPHPARKIQGEEAHSGPRLEHRHSFANVGRHNPGRILRKAADRAGEKVSEPPGADSMRHTQRA